MVSHMQVPVGLGLSYKLLQLYKTFLAHKASFHIAIYSALPDLHLFI